MNIRIVTVSVMAMLLGVGCGSAQATGGNANATGQGSTATGGDATATGGDPAKDAGRGAASGAAVGVGLPGSNVNATAGTAPPPPTAQPTAQPKN